MCFNFGLFQIIFTYGVHILNVNATRQSEDSGYVCFSPLSYLGQWWVTATLFWNWWNLDLRGQVRDCFVTCVVFFSDRSSGCLLFAVLDPDEQEVVVEVPRVVQNPPKPVMITRPTAVKATGIVVVFFWFFLIHCLQYLSLGSNCVCIWCFDECFSKFILPLDGNLTSLWGLVVVCIHFNQCKICYFCLSVPILISTTFSTNAIFKIYFILKDNCFTEFCCFLSNLNMNQPLGIHISPSFWTSLPPASPS